jgi:pectate lyase
MKKLFLLIAFVALYASGASAQQQLAFPGADGFGKFATGGRGGEVCYVTRLDDCADNNLVEGTLRWALRHDNGGRPRTILFKVGGTIRTTSDLKFQYGDVSILGQTAPGGGICIAGYKFYICRDNVIIRYVRFRAGDLAGYEKNKSSASVDMENCKNIILDHCSITWSMEECLTAYDSDYTTVQWCIIGEGLYNSMNAKGARSYATQWGGEHSTMHHCLITNCNNRTPRFNGVRSESKIGQGEHTHDAQVESEFANNVIFNWGKSNSLYGGEDSKTINNDADGNHLGYNRVYMINNYFRPGPNTKKNVNGTRYFVQGDKTGDGGYGEWYLNGNMFEENSAWAGTGNQWNATNIASVNADNYYGFIAANSARAFNLNGVSASTGQSLYDTYVMKALPEGGLSGLEYEGAADAFSAVCAKAGASLPSYDAVDTRLLKEAKGDIDPKYYGPTSETNDAPARGIGIIDTPNNIDLSEYGDKYVTLEATYTKDGETLTATNIYPDLSGESTVVDSDADGMPDVYEDNAGLAKNNPADGAVVTSSGYTNLEEFLNGVADGKYTSDGEIIPDAISAVTTTGKVARITYYNAAGMQVAQPQHGLNVVVETMDNGSEKVSKVMMK